MNSHTSNMLCSCDKTPVYAPRTSASVVGTVIPMESKGRGSIRRFLEAGLPFLRLVGDTLPLVGTILAFSSSSFRTLNDSSTFLQKKRRSGGASAGDGYSANNNEQENLWRSLMLMVPIMLGVVGVGNPETIHSESFSYAFSSSTRKPNDRRRQHARTYERAERTRDDILQEMGAADEC